MRKFLEEIETFLTAYPHVRPSQIGKQAIGDSVFVADLRAGRTARGKTQERVRRWMADFAKREAPLAESRSRARRRVEALAVSSAPVHGAAGVAAVE